jgi:hypothetical protein
MAAFGTGFPQDGGDRGDFKVGILRDLRLSSTNTVLEIYQLVEVDVFVYVSRHAGHQPHQFVRIAKAGTFLDKTNHSLASNPKLSTAGTARSALGTLSFARTAPGNQLSP